MTKSNSHNREKKAIEVSSIEKAYYGHLAVSKLQQMLAYDCRVHAAARRIFSLIAAHSDENGNCFPSLSLMAKRLKISRPAVSKQVRLLQSYGYLTAHPQRREGFGQTTNLYVLNFPLARKYWKNAWAFSAAALDINTSETSTGYGDPQHIEGTPPETPKGYSKTTPLKKPLEEEAIILQGKRKAISWAQQVENEQKTGITRETMSEFFALNDKLGQYMSHEQKFQFSRTIDLLLKDLPPNQQAAEKIRLYKEKVQNLSAISLKNN